MIESNETPKMSRLADAKEEFNFDVITNGDKEAQFKVTKRKKSQLDNSFSNVNVIEDVVLKRKFTISVNVTLAGKASFAKGKSESKELDDAEEQTLANLQVLFTKYLKTIQDEIN